MTQLEINQLERDVEDSRERLSGALQRLRSPATLSDFKDALWAEADDSRDQLVAKTKETVDELVVKAKESVGELVVKAKESVDELVVKTKQGAGELVATSQEAVRDSAWRFLADLKERAAANPAAALAIGAGLAWRIARKPPITTMLVGAGVIGLMRTNPQKSYPGAEMASQVGDFAVEAKEKVEQWSADAGQIVSQAGEVASSVKETVEQWSSDAGEAIWQVAGATKTLTDRSTETLYGIVQDAEERDKYLLGAAAVALVAAVGFAYQRRVS
jgi:F0F1-type ATP synthase membrane subunit b/b'